MRQTVRPSPDAAVPTNDPLAEQIAQRLRRDIMRGNLPPGASLKERDNAQELGVSRTPMREAIRILAKEGLVQLRPSRSPVVTTPTFQEVADQAAVLIALEKLSAELACANAAEADFARIQAILGRMTDMYGHADTLELFEVDMSFHTAIAEASHNTALVETHHAFLTRLWYARYLSAKQERNRKKVISQHGAILTVLRNRSPSAVRAAIGRHLKNMTQDVAEVLPDLLPAVR